MKFPPQFDPLGAFKALVAFGIIARLAVMGVSYGSNDMATWARFASSIRTDGLWQLYEADPLFNHPPLMGILAAALHALADATSIPYRVVFKLPMLAGDIFVLILLRGIWSQQRLSWMAMAIFACNPVSILVTAHHGNTDSLCGAFLLLAARQHNRGAMFTAGLALAAAGNVKIVAAMCLPALVLLIRDWPSLRRYIGGGLLGSLPFVVAVVFGGTVFLENVFLYGSALGAWGFAAAVALVDVLTGWGVSSANAYLSPGRVVLLASFAALAVFGRRRSWSPYLAITMAFASFLVFTPGWGIQYHVWIVPVLAAHSIKDSAMYAAIVGVFVTATYANHLTDELPLRSAHETPVLSIVLILAVVGWAWLIGYLWRNVRPQPVGSLHSMAG